MRKAHRYIAVFVVLFGLYISCTGLFVQALDLKAVLSHAPASDPTMRGIRVGIYGPPNFQVIRESDFGGPALPDGFDFDRGLAAVLKGARPALAGGPLRFVEFRAVDGRPVGEVSSGGQVYQFDAASGAESASPRPLVLPKMEAPSLRNQMKAIHRFRAYGGWAILIDIVAGLLIIAMIVTGLFTYWRMWLMRRKMRRPAPIWRAGGWWRTLHRATALLAALFLLVVAVTGTVLSMSSIGVVVMVQRLHGKRPVITDDFSRPMRDAELPGMLHTTLAAYRAGHPGLPIRAVRLRYFAGMPQGVVVTGAKEADQLVYHATEGREVSLTEPNYPAPGQTFGWQVDETFKMIHRGDYFGLTGRAMSVLTGLALLYLSISGAMIYYELWRTRRRKGRHGLFWSP